VLGRATAGRWLAAFSAMSALAIMWAPIEQLAESYGFTRPPGGLLAFAAVIGALAAVGEPRRPGGSRRLFALIAAGPSLGAVILMAPAIQPEPWFFYRLHDQVALRIGAGILLGIALVVIAVVLLVGGDRAWAAALAVNSVPWLLLFSLAPWVGGISASSTRAAGLLAAVIVVALLAGLTALALSRRGQPAMNSGASSE
jgi:hypothetical protein